MAENNSADAHNDIVPQDNVGAEEPVRRTSKVDALFPKEFHAKDPEKETVEQLSGSGSADGLPAYEGEEYARRQSAIVTTAEDLVTNVISVEDDTTLNPWTFRTFFLGKSLVIVLHRDGSVCLGTSDSLPPSEISCLTRLV